MMMMMMMMSDSVCVTVFCFTGFHFFYQESSHIFQWNYAFFQQLHYWVMEFYLAFTHWIYGTWKTMELSVLCITSNLCQFWNKII